MPQLIHDTLLIIAEAIVASDWNAYDRLVALNSLEQTSAALRRDVADLRLTRLSSLDPLVACLSPTIVQELYRARQPSARAREEWEHPDIKKLRSLVRTLEFTGQTLPPGAIRYLRDLLPHNEPLFPNLRRLTLTGSAATTLSLQLYHAPNLDEVELDASHIDCPELLVRGLPQLAAGSPGTSALSVSWDGPVTPLTLFPIAQLPLLRQITLHVCLALPLLPVLAAVHHLEELTLINSIWTPDSLREAPGTSLFVRLQRLSVTSPDPRYTEGVLRVIDAPLCSTLTLPAAFAALPTSLDGIWDASIVAFPSLSTVQLDVNLQQLSTQPGSTPIALTRLIQPLFISAVKLEHLSLAFNPGGKCTIFTPDDLGAISLHLSSRLKTLSIRAKEVCHGNQLELRDVPVFTVVDLQDVIQFLATCTRVERLVLPGMWDCTPLSRSRALGGSTHYSFPQFAISQRTGSPQQTCQSDPGRLRSTMGQPLTCRVAPHSLGANSKRLVDGTFHTSPLPAPKGSALTVRYLRFDHIWSTDGLSFLTRLRSHFPHARLDNDLVFVPLDKDGQPICE